MHLRCITRQAFARSKSSQLPKTMGWTCWISSIATSGSTKTPFPRYGSACLLSTHTTTLATTPTTTSSGLHHDIGGDLSSFGPIDLSKNAADLDAWEQQCHSLFVVLATKQLVTTDQLRRAIEGLTGTQYRTWSYYEKWSAAMASLLLESNVVTHEELSVALFGNSHKDGDGDADEASTEPLFATGEKVRVKAFSQGVEWQRPHIRTPGYIYGVAGIVERYAGLFPDPSFLAFGWKAPSQHLYRVKFRLCDIWPEQYPNHGDNTDDGDVVEVEVYQHWLEPSDQAKGHAYEGRTLFDHQHNGDDCLHSDDDHHHHHHDEHDHEHEARPLVEQRAIDREGPPRPGKQVHQTLMKILLEKGLVTANEVRQVSEKLDTAGKKLDGASLVVEAWTNPAFYEKLVANAPAAASEIGIATSNPNAPTILTVVPNTPNTHNLVVCTLCSCYPSGLLGIAPSWYKSREFRSRAVREPRRVLQEDFGLNVSAKPTIRVHDSTADHRYLVLPTRPAGTEGWSKEDLRALVTRDTMIGVAEPKVV
eukprot:scaffold638_cov168-Amphora_coffeaeformis.AAC.15